MNSKFRHFIHLSTLGLGGVLVVAFVLSASTASALDPNSKDAQAIAQAVADRNDGDKQMARSVWTLTDSSGRNRERVLQMWSMDFAGGTKILMIYESPADVRNTGFLSVNYDDDNKDDDQWLYLPSLHKTTRIASANRSDSFLGTDLSYYDLNSKPNVDATDYKLLEFSVKVDGDDCWLLEATPKTEKEKKESGYLKRQVWISKKSLLPVQVKAWLAKGQKLKYIKFSEIKEINGIWTPHKFVVRTMKNEKVESTTTVKFTSIKFNQASVKDEDFSQRRLEKGL
ncbi:MAG: outer membrane lipoprotein-sorting protein [Deltaproteobacteria bacterium]|nr:outer membrane lipoprotein-sorting protein [Deltaproteobacteria bacterium]